MICFSWLYVSLVCSSMFYLVLVCSSVLCCVVVCYILPKLDIAQVSSIVLECALV